MTLDEKIAALRQQQAGAESRKARAEVELAVAEKRQQDAQDALKAEFGIETTEQAQAALKAAEDDLAAECRRLEDALVQARGPE